MSQSSSYLPPDAPHIAEKGHWFGARDSLIGKVIKGRRDIPADYYEYMLLV
jgi:hypothetical protein